MLKQFQPADIAALQQSRAGETRLGQVLQYLNPLLPLADALVSAQSRGARYALVGIPEDIGPRANFGQGGADLGFRALHRGRIGHAPMGGHRLAGPDRADFACGVVTDREDEIERRRARRGELLPRFRAEVVQVEAAALDDGPDMRIDPPRRHGPGGIGFEAARAFLVHQRLGDHRARRIAGA